MKAAGTSETLAPIQQSGRHQIIKDLTSYWCLWKFKALHLCVDKSSSELDNSSTHSQKCYLMSGLLPATNLY